jgi:hypothetical protein
MSELSRLDADLERALLLGRRLPTLAWRAAARRVWRENPALA